MGIGELGGGCVGGVSDKLSASVRMTVATPTARIGSDAKKHSTNSAAEQQRMCGLGVASMNSVDCTAGCLTNCQAGPGVVSCSSSASSTTHASCANGFGSHTVLRRTAPRVGRPIVVLSPLRVESTQKSHNKTRTERLNKGSGTVTCMRCVSQALYNFDLPRAASSPCNQSSPLTLAAHCCCTITFAATLALSVERRTWADLASAARSSRAVKRSRKLR